MRGRADALVDRSPGIPASGQPEDDVSDKPRSVQMPPLSDAEIEAEARVTRQRAESLFVLDLEVARLVDTLRDTGELDDTVLIFTSDNGYFLGEHRKRMGKKLPYEPSIRVPLVLAGPGVPPGTRYDPVVTPDLTATIIDLAGARPPHPADGTSLRWNIRNGDRGWTVPVVTEAIADRASAGGTPRSRGARVHRRPDDDRAADRAVQARPLGLRRGRALRPRARPQRADATWCATRRTPRSRRA